MINAATQTPILSGGHRIRGHSDEFRASMLDFSTRITKEGDDVTRFRVFQKQQMNRRPP